MTKQILLNNKDIPRPPDFVECPFCQSKIERAYVRQTCWRYSCNNHLPLRVEANCISLADPDGNWFFSSMTISLPHHFQFYWNQNNLYFQLKEWRNSNSLKGYWRLNNTFTIDWIFSQSAERLLSILQMYKTFS